ncbi:MAG: hypothetical protein GC165_11150 [Armatimonadetes bacterium]|nr:hypothetical protein [Armatimonadota bacterium]
MLVRLKKYGKLIILSALASAVLLGNGYRVIERNRFWKQREKAYFQFTKGIGIEIPHGTSIPASAPESGPSFHAVDLGVSNPVSTNDLGDLILSCDGKTMPSDYKGQPKEGLFIRSPKGEYRYLGLNPAQYSRDGHLVECVGEMDSRKLLVDGEEVANHPVRRLSTSVDRNRLFESSGGKFYNIRYDASQQDFIFDSNGSTQTISRKPVSVESPIVAGLRMVGIFEPTDRSIATQSVVMDRKGKVYGEMWGGTSLYACEESRSARLCQLTETGFELVPELEQVQINSEMVMSNGGVLGLNAVKNCSWASRPLMVRDHQLTYLPIPNGYQMAEMVGIRDDGTCLINARHKDIDSKTFLWTGNQYFDLSQLSIQGLNEPIAPWSKYQTTFRTPNDNLVALMLENPLLPNGDILARTVGEHPHLVLLKPDGTKDSKIQTRS